MKESEIDRERERERESAHRSTHSRTQCSCGGQMTTVRSRFAPVGPKNQTQLLRLGCRFLFPPNHLSGPPQSFDLEMSAVCASREEGSREIISHPSSGCL